jgi:CheY-like chemotaxis protein
MATAPKRESWKRASRSVSVSGSARSPKIMRQRPCRPPASKTLLWIDDYEPGLALYKAVFEGFGFNVLTASGGRKGLDLAASHDFDAVVVDYEMPEMDGGEVAAELKSSCPDLPIVMFTGSDAISHRARNLVDAVCDKAGSRNELLATIREIIGDSAETTFLPPAIKAERMAALKAA